MFYSLRNKPINVFYRPLQKDEVLPKQIYKKSLKNAKLAVHTVPSTSDDHDTHKITDDKATDEPKSKKKSLTSESKTSVSNKKEKKAKDKDKEARKEPKMKKIKSVKCADEEDELNLLGTPVKQHNHHNPHKKDKKSTKEKKHSKDAAKSGYEEALGISTPSKEVY